MVCMNFFPFLGLILQQAIVKGWQKPQSLITKIMQRHMNVPEGYILDAMCGTATTTLCALNLGMHAVAFDEELNNCYGSMDRLAKIHKSIGPVEEVMSRTEWAAAANLSKPKASAATRPDKTLDLTQVDPSTEVPVLEKPPDDDVLVLPSEDAVASGPDAPETTVATLLAAPTAEILGPINVEAGDKNTASGKDADAAQPVEEVSAKARPKRGTETAGAVPAEAAAPSEETGPPPGPGQFGYRSGRNQAKAKK